VERSAFRADFSASPPFLSSPALALLQVRATEDTGASVEMTGGFCKTCRKFHHNLDVHPRSESLAKNSGLSAQMAL
jgi:hypothetical protein